MSIERIQELEEILQKRELKFRADPKASKKGEFRRLIDRVRLIEEVNTKVPDLHARLAEFHRLLTHSKLGNKLDLGTDVNSVNWLAMPQQVADCFRPEFAYQPEEITAFYIRSNDSDDNGKYAIEIRLDRNRKVWSWVNSGVINRHYKGAAIYIGRFPEQAQPTAARAAMDSLEHSLWGDALGSKDTQLSELYHDVNGLRLTESILGFAVDEVERHLLEKAPRPRSK